MDIYGRESKGGEGLSFWIGVKKYIDKFNYLEYLNDNLIRLAFISLHFWFDLMVGQVVLALQNVWKNCELNLVR